MKELLQRIRQKAAINPRQMAIRDELGQLDYEQLIHEVNRLSVQLKGERIGLMTDNSVAWACLDLAIMSRGVVCVPMPNFFSADQLRHLMVDADLDEIITDQPKRLAELLGDSSSSDIRVANHELSVFHRMPTASRPLLPAGTIKVTYTSGTTGQPKGVCLSARTLTEITRALSDAVVAKESDCSLSLLPLSTLLENIAGVYVPLWSGALAQVPSLSSCGFAGSSGLDIGKLFANLVWSKPSSVVLVPQLLKAIVGGISAGLPMPESLRFVAVGGAPVADSLLQDARALGLPVYQGYGLSEAGSVVCLNLPGASREKSVGKPLPHLRVAVQSDGEIIVSGPVHLGYLGAETNTRQTDWSTGDLGYLDQEGYLFLTGRKKTAYSTAFGRNVSPEWVEAALTGQYRIAQAALFGEGQPFNVAILVPNGDVTSHELAHAVHSVNQHLPDYARVAHWIVAKQPFTPANQLMSPSGSIQRQRVYSEYQEQIENLYFSAQEKTHAIL
jgi:long-subunit acyl-CoA synthetase (AMP-forming)